MKAEAVDPATGGKLQVVAVAQLIIVVAIGRVVGRSGVGRDLICFVAVWWLRINVVLLGGFGERLALLGLLLLLGDQAHVLWNRLDFLDVGGLALLELLGASGPVVGDCGFIGRPRGVCILELPLLAFYGIHRRGLVVGSRVVVLHDAWPC